MIKHYFIILHELQVNHTFGGIIILMLLKIPNNWKF